MTIKELNYEDYDEFLHDESIDNRVLHVRGAAVSVYNYMGELI